MPIARTAIQDTIQSTLQGIVGVANVHTDEVRVNNMNDMKAKYEQGFDEFLQLWTIHRVSSNPHTADTHRGQVPISDVNFYHKFSVELFWAYKEEGGETAFQKLIDDVLDVFKVKRTLGAFNTSAPLALTNITPTWRHGVFGKVAQFEVTVIDAQRALAWE
ncbi:MAG: hypothetical protein M0Q49_03295 [Porticoccaceae bacterium]|nr:hypothetical protein [Porticoccaceae bacterium]